MLVWTICRNVWLWKPPLSVMDGETDHVPIQVADILTPCAPWLVVSERTIDTISTAFSSPGSHFFTSFPACLALLLRQCKHRLGERARRRFLGQSFDEGFCQGNDFCGRPWIEKRVIDVIENCGPYVREA